MYVKPYAADEDCFVSLMEIFSAYYGHYPKYPVADVGYSSLDNYIYCEKETKDENGSIPYPNGHKFTFKYTKPIKGHIYGRTEEIYEYKNCESCSYKKCCSRAKKNRMI